MSLSERQKDMSFRGVAMTTTKPQNDRLFIGVKKESKRN